MLHIAPRHWFSWDVTVTEQSRRVADVATSCVREKGTVTIGDATYQVYREGIMSGPFVLEQDGRVLARAEKPSVFRRTFLIRHADREYMLRPKSLFGRTYILMRGSQEVGSLAPEGAFTRKAAANLPPDLPLPVRMFIVWLTVIAWRREQSS